MKIELTSIKTQFIIFLSAFAVFISIKDKDALFPLAILIAVISAAGIESVFFYLKNKKFTVTESSVISGLIIGYVLSSDQPWWIIALASLFTIGSKYLIRFNKKHIFDPAALGVFLATIFFGASTQWRGAYLWFIILPFGFYFIYKIRKLEVLLSYGLVSLILFGIQAVMQKVSLWHIFGYLNYFFIFIMLIEPKTTPIRQIGKIIFGTGVAILIFVLIEVGAKFDVELFSLLILNLFVPLLNRIPERRLI